ncbi:MAG: hypothetical protein QF579_05270 [Dehalococcoidia bacterium]|jgi:hypothetical protein|nr:hypothetical protein [Dehalococcoidia bacterium]
MTQSDAPKIAEGEFRAYDVAIEEVVKGTETFLTAVGYELLVPDYVGFVQPDFRAKRQDGDTTHEVLLVVESAIELAVDGFVKLAAMKPVLGESIDYGVVLPPINEYLLLEWLQEDRGRNFYELKRQDFMLWMYNPAEEAMWSWIGGPRDRAFSEHFVLPGMSPEVIVGQRLAWVLEEELEEEL